MEPQLSGDTDGIEIRFLQPSDAAVIRAILPAELIGTVIGGMFDEIVGFLGANNITPTGQAFGRFRRAGDKVEMGVGFTADRPITPSGRIVSQHLPGGEAAVATYRGPYEDVSQAYDAVRDWLQKNERIAAAEPWEVYLSSPEEDPPRIEIVFPLQSSAHDAPGVMPMASRTSNKQRRTE
jgi:effector-binding domain-containing protein